MTKPLIVVATDLSEQANAAARQGAALAEALGARVTLFHSYDPIPAVPPAAIPDVARFEASIEKEIVASIQSSIKRVREEFFAELEDVEVAVERGTAPAKAICDFAKENGAKMIVVSTHGRTGLKHMLIGSVAERCVRHAPCSVLVVR